MSYAVETGSRFEKEIKRLKKRYASLPDDFARLLDQLEAEGTVGTPLGRDCYKIRLAIASKNKGKSGGARVITCVRVVAGVVTLLPKQVLHQTQILLLSKSATTCYAKMACYKS